MRAVAEREGWAPFDVALDTVGTAHSERGALALLRKGVGRYVTLHGQLAGLVGERGVLVGGAAAALELARKKMLHRMSDDVGYHWAVMRQDADAMAEIGEAPHARFPPFDRTPYGHFNGEKARYLQRQCGHLT